LQWWKERRRIQYTAGIKNGLSKHLSPETLIVGTPAPDLNEIIKLNFGDYVQTYDGETDSSNKSRYIGAISLTFWTW